MAYWKTKLKSVNKELSYVTLCGSDLWIRLMGSHGPFGRGGWGCSQFLVAAFPWGLQAVPGSVGRTAQGRGSGVWPWQLPLRGPCNPSRNGVRGPCHCTGMNSFCKEEQLVSEYWEKALRAVLFFNVRVKYQT